MPKALQLGRQFFDLELVNMSAVTPDQVQRAWRLFRDEPQRRWSFTDCTRQGGDGKTFTFAKLSHLIATSRSLPTSKCCHDFDAIRRRTALAGRFRMVAPTHHLIHMLLPETHPLEGRTPCATTGRRFRRRRTNTHFMFRILDQGGEYWLDPWILFWTYSVGKERANESGQSFQYPVSGGRTRPPTCRTCDETWASTPTLNTGQVTRVCLTLRSRMKENENQYYGMLEMLAQS